MIEQNPGGTIVNVSSGAGVVPAPGQPHYTAAKHAVLGLTKHAAQEYARSGIRVNAVLPGQTETEPMKAYLDAQPDRGARLLSRMPMGRMAQPTEIAESIAWLCSDASSYVNGVCRSLRRRPNRTVAVEAHSRFFRLISPGLSIRKNNTHARGQGRVIRLITSGTSYNSQRAQPVTGPTVICKIQGGEAAGLAAAPRATPPGGPHLRLWKS